MKKELKAQNEFKKAGGVKIGAVAWGLPGGGSYAARVAKAAGLDGIQLELGSYEDGYPLAQKDVQEGYLEDRLRYDIEYPAIVLNDVMVHEFINGKNTENGKIAYDQIALSIETAKSLGIDRIMIPNFLKNLITNESHLEQAKEALVYACRLAKPEGILILTENALDWKKEENLLKDVGADNLKIHFDTQNFKFNFDMDQCEQLEGLYPHLDSVMHTKDGIDKPGESLLGEGNTNFHGQMKYLKQQGFEGFIVIENYYNLLPLRGRAQKDGQMGLLLKDIAALRKYFS